MKNILTVNGPVNVNDCKMVLSHEHIFIDLTNQAAAAAVSDKISLADRDTLLKDPYCMKDNLLLDNMETAVAEGKNLAAFGCNTIVDCTTSEIGRDPVLLKKFADASGLHVVTGCGWYTGDTHSKATLEKSVEQLAEELFDEVVNGIGSTGIRPGVIGEIGTSKKILPNEWRCLEAAAVVQKKCNLALQVHIYPWSTNGLDVTDFLLALGVAPDRIVICHPDIAPDYSYITALFKRGVRVEMDNFGKEFTPADGGFADGAFATDKVRAEIAARIIRDGFGKQLLLTNDICLKCMLRQYGGRGYSHVFDDILPLIVEKGIPEEYLKYQIMHSNPLDMLAGK